jgi:hypothetical protein
MPRPWELSVEAFPPRSPSHWYRCRVIGIGKSKEPAGLLVTLEDMDEGQRGRRTSTVLSVPVRPAGLPHDFFVACGQEVSAGKKVSPRATIGALLRVCFGPAHDDEELVPISFESLSKEPPHGQ